MAQQKIIGFHLIHKFLYKTNFNKKVHAIRENNWFPATT